MTRLLKKIIKQESLKTNIFLLRKFKIPNYIRYRIIKINNDKRLKQLIKKIK